MWNSSQALNYIVTFLDYAGGIDVFAAFVLLIVWFRNKESSDRTLGLLGISLSILAGALWVADAKCAHRLTQLQQLESNKETSDLRSDLKAANKQYGDTTNRLAVAEADLSQERAKVAQLIKAAEPQSLTEDAANDIFSGTRDLPKTKVLFVYTSQDPEISALVDQIAVPLGRAGFALMSSPTQMISSKVYRGIAIWDCRGTNTALVTTIVKGINKAGYAASTNRDDSMGAMDADIFGAGVVVSVGKK